MYEANDTDQRAAAPTYACSTAAPSSDVPTGLIGRIVEGEHRGFYVEVDDDTERSRGTGGYYVLLWDQNVGYDEWYESADAMRAAIEERWRVDWLSEDESAAVLGRHRHGPS